MELKLNTIHEARALYEAVEDRLEKTISEAERDRLLMLRSRIEEFIRREK